MNAKKVTMSQASSFFTSQLYAYSTYPSARQAKCVGRICNRKIYEFAFSCINVYICLYIMLCVCVLYVDSIGVEIFVCYDS